MTSIACEVVEAREVTAGDVLWIAVDGFQEVRGRLRADAKSVSFLLANDIVAHRMAGDQALIQARTKARSPEPKRAVPRNENKDGRRANDGRSDIWSNR